MGVVCCFALLFVPLLASFFLPSHLSLKHAQYISELDLCFVNANSQILSLTRVVEVVAECSNEESQ